ncbi:response regulator [Paenibacillus thalictri]|uniref:Response regulator n=1 Tax=Paenibacillus thalictri TaxID=2527873 RepID=A0A4Q9DK71_9BACL|nr:response regulator [Paenibacillus thalictri]TBL73968.1 response regulator [Paenibacillus thalictri]
MKVMVIDDEPIVPKALRSLIDWESWGFEWIAPAGNGEEALMAIEEHQPELILVDCKMPIIDGLELLRIVKQRGLPIKSVILSGHDEFTYAQQAIQLGAADYLLKPPDIDQLQKVVLRIKKEWEEERKLKRQVKENLPLMRDRFLRSLLDGAQLHKAVFEEKTGYLGIPLVDGTFYTMCLQIEEHPDYPKNYGYEDQQLINFAVLNIASETLQSWPRRCLFWESQERFALMVNAAKADMEKLRHDLRQLIANLSGTLRYYATVGACFSDDSPASGVKAAWDKAKTALEYKYYTGPNEIIFIHELEWEQETFGGKPPLQTFVESAVPGEPLRMALKLGNEDQLNDWLDQFIGHFKQHEMPVQTTKVQSLQALISSSHTLGELHPQLQQDEVLTQEDIDSIWGASDIEQLGATLRRLFGKLLTLTTDMRKSGKHAVVEKTKELIGERYAQDLSLDSLAAESLLSPVYLSFLFKQVEGINLTDYLIQVRLEHAKRLLKDTPLRTYEVANQVGYADEKYFSRLFKKRVGLTPSEFRHQ